MKRLKLLILLLCLSCAISAQESLQNYILTRQMLNETGNSYIANISYFDGLGRQFQTVQKSVKNGVKTGNNLATLQEYDNAGRETNAWLPIVSSGDYTAPATFKSNASGNYGNDSRPYNQTAYESSPLNRVAQQYGPGAAWYSAGRAVKTEYLTNTTSSPLNCINYSVSAAGTPINNGNYPAGQLYVVKSTDEDMNISYTFTDKLDRTVLTRQMKGSEAHDTYYVYDDFNNLRFVLQPMYQSNTSLDLYAFQYKYDGHRNCIYKKMPGAQYIEYTYDNADRLTFSQDGNQRAVSTTISSQKWTYYMYDNLGRLTQQGECTGKNVSSNQTVLVQNYYDSYSFLGTTGFPTATYTAGNTNGKGYLTGSVATVLGSSNTKIYKAFYYDIKGQVVKSIQNNLLSGYDITSTVYTFSGKPATVTHTHTANGKTTRTEVYTYTYDHVDRISKVQHTLGGTTVTLYDATYDKFGRLYQKRHHVSYAQKPTYADSLTYAYNIRSWLTGISGTKFTQNLYYNTGIGAAKYNGSISSMTWKAGNESTIRGYKFTYDGMDRMLNATYGETASINSNAGRFSENVTAYDKNGNIKTLQRYGQLSTSTYGLLDNLTYTLTGNQLSRVDDAVSTAAYGINTAFVNGASAAGEYAYDANGNLTKDLNKGITRITYNVLNLPNVVTFSDGSTITYTYGADGTKLRTVHKIGSTTTTTDYCGNVIYENGTQKLLLTEEGYVNLTGTQQYHYYLKDHQGNNRVVINQNGTVEETNHYYPFGGVFASTNIQPYKYNGKEYDNKKGLNWYDYGARHYDPVLGRFTTVDPLAEKYYSTNPYAYCLNNPVNSIDPNGMQVKPYGEQELTMIQNTLAKQERKYVSLDKNGYINKELLNSYSSESGNFNALKELVNSDYDISVRLDDSYSYIDNDGNTRESKMNYVEADEFLADKNFEYTSGLTTGEGGNNGVTLLPGKGESGVNSSSNSNIEVIINKNLSENGRAEIYGHEANGHALMYVRTGNRHKSAHQFAGSKEMNIPLRNMIISSRKETIRNIKKQ